jgi:hypothetical protein
MISPLSTLVLAPSLLVSLPALYSVWRGTMPFDVGLSRFLVVQFVCWVALSAAARMVPAGDDPQDSDAQGLEDQTAG